MARPLPDRKTVPQFAAQKSHGSPLVIVTAYDAPQGRLADSAGVDAILVGDSVGMTTLGYSDTLPVTVDDMIHHTRAVARGQEAYSLSGEPRAADTARGAKHALLIADLPFGSYGASIEQGVQTGVRLVSEGGAQAVKLEGASAIHLETIRRLAAIGVPVMGHLGMTPQSIHRFGGFRLQAKSERAGDVLLEEARSLVESGVFAIVLEVIPATLAERVTKAIPAPTIGIGAGPGCDGQVQVLHDLVGLTGSPTFRHSRRYADLSAQVEAAIAEYASDVRSGRFPTVENSF